MRASIIELLTPNGGEEEEILDFERGVSDSELGKTGAALTGIAGGNYGFWMAESFALRTLLPLALRTYSPASWRAVETNSSESQ